MRTRYIATYKESSTRQCEISIRKSLLPEVFRLGPTIKAFERKCLLSKVVKNSFLKLKIFLQPKKQRERNCKQIENQGHCGLKTGKIRKQMRRKMLAVACTEKKQELRN